MPMGPFRVADMSGLDTVVKVAQRHAATPTATASTSTRAWRSGSSAATSAPRPGRGSMSTAEEPKLDAAIAERFQLKALVEACLVLEEGIAGGARDRPRADARHRHGARAVRARRFPRARRRPRRAGARRGRLGPALRAAARRSAGSSPRAASARKSGQGFYPYPQPEPGYEQAVVKLDRRGDDVAILWLDNPPANSIAPAHRGIQIAGRLGLFARGQVDARRLEHRALERDPVFRSVGIWPGPPPGSARRPCPSRYARRLEPLAEATASRASGQKTAAMPTSRQRRKVSGQRSAPSRT